MPCGVQARKSGGTASPAVEARRTVRLATLSSFGLGFIKRRRFDLRYMGPGSMRTRRELILGAACAAAAGLALAAEPSPHDFVAAIYDAYKGKDAHGRPLDDDDAIRRYFEPKLAAAMIKDRRAAARRKEVGTLDFDPIRRRPGLGDCRVRHRCERRRPRQSKRNRQIRQPGQQKHSRARSAEDQGGVEDQQHHLDAARQAEYAARSLRALKSARAGHSVTGAHHCNIIGGNECSNKSPRQEFCRAPRWPCCAA